MSSDKKINLVIIGNGMVGYKLCEKIVDTGVKERFNIHVFGEEPVPAYNRVRLTEYFNKSLNDLTLAPSNWYQDHQIELHLGDPVLSIDRIKKIVVSKEGIRISYDKLVFATGSSPFIPPIIGTDKKGVFLYRTIEDLDKIKEYAKDVDKATVIGGGLLGLEAAKALLDMGLETHVLEVAPRLMPRQLDESASEILKGKLEDTGVHIHTGKSITQFSGNGSVNEVLFHDSSNLPTDLIVISAGIKPRDELARDCQLEIAPRGGIRVNKNMQTSDPDIYAIGEVASYNEMTYGLVAPGYEMADIALSHLIGENKHYNGSDLSTKLKLIGVDVASFGEATELKELHRTIVFNDKVKGVYKRLNISVDGKYILGGILVGDSKEYNKLAQMMKNNDVLPEDPSELIIGRNAEKENILSLHDSAQICACNNVTKGMIVSAIHDNNLGSLPEIKSCTKAGTECGGCIPMVQEILDAVNQKKGLNTRKVLCEHFNYTRQELFDIIKVKNMKTFNELKRHYGKGNGCEICKPAIASMLASAWNDLVIKQQHIQDTNDKFLANIQMGGTYSIVPRIPGGEITPDGLIALGEIAKKYDLYCKFTGGQRIDFFGAKLNDLPEIWRELGHYGFESGHAYARGMRTVKSCVGSTWCHLGVQDSVTFSIQVENRYKGIRFPHKVKSAVSGCVRECAEAQSKDFGIIATEKGWNLYLCGNAGLKPQHALLFATDLDSETCIKYIDRFLMFYIKTADHLTRTATWFNKLDGGIEYLKDVLIRDSLGICEQLEQEMQSIIDNYHCEWAETVKDSEHKKKFRYFVNSSSYDPSIQFRDERGQKVPELSIS